MGSFGGSFGMFGCFGGVVGWVLVGGEFVAAKAGREGVTYVELEGLNS